MKHVVSFSGGRTSAYLVHLMEKKRINEGWDVEYVFMDTGAEHPKTYDFIRNVIKHWGIKLTCLRTVVHHEYRVGVTYEVIDIDSIGWDLSTWREVVKKYDTPYLGGAHCTKNFKTTPYNKYCKDKYGINYTSWLGIRIDEVTRLKPFPRTRYLAELSIMERDDIIEWFKDQSFDLVLDEWLGNCVFCLKKGVNKIALAIKDEPELANEFNQMLSDGPNKREIPSKIIYRGNLSIEGISNLYKDVSRPSIIEGLRRGKHFDSGSCTESCEVFGCQIDMFEDDAA